MKLRIFLLINLLAFLFMSGCTSSNINMQPKKTVTSYCQEIIEVLYPFNIDIFNVSGNIAFYSWDTDEVKFEITRMIRGTEGKNRLINMLKDIKIDIEQEDDKVVFKTDYNGSIKNPANMGVDLKVYIPKNIDSIDISLDVGTIKFYDDIKSELNLKVNTVNVDINKIIGKLVLSADMCDLRISDGRLVSGSSVKTNFGNIRIKAEFDDTGQYDFATNIGSIDLNLPKDSGIDMLIEGNIRQNEFQSSIDGAKILLRSGMGDISLKKTG